MKLSDLEYIPRKGVEGELVHHIEYCTAEQMETEISETTQKYLNQFKNPVIIEKGVLPQLKMFITIAEKTNQ